MFGKATPSLLIILLFGCDVPNPVAFTSEQAGVETRVVRGTECPTTDVLKAEKGYAEAELVITRRVDLRPLCYYRLTPHPVRSLAMTTKCSAPPRSFDLTFAQFRERTRTTAFAPTDKDALDAKDAPKDAAQVLCTKDEGAVLMTQSARAEEDASEECPSTLTPEAIHALTFNTALESDDFEAFEVNELLAKEGDRGSVTACKYETEREIEQQHSASCGRGCGGVGLNPSAM